MAFQRGKSGNPKGRKPGSPNKLTTAAKSAIEAAAEGLGGAKRLQAWAASDPLNERVFWSQIYTKLLPVQLQSDPDAPLMPAAVSFVFKQRPDSENRT